MGMNSLKENIMNVGIAVGTDRGLVVPVLRDCQLLGIAEIEKGIEGFANAAREGKLTVDSLQGGSFTIYKRRIYGRFFPPPSSIPLKVVF